MAWKGLKLSLFASIMFSSCIPRATAVESWNVYFSQGINCNSASSGDTTGPTHPKDGKVCYAIPNVGYTSSLDLNTANSNYTLGLHEQADCQDPGGIFKGVSSDHPVCIPIDNAIAFSIITNISGTYHQRAEVPPNHNQAPGSDHCQIPTFTLKPDAIGTSFWTFADGKCPAVATTSNVDQDACAMKAIYSVILSFLTGFSVKGLYNNGQEKRDLLSELIQESRVSGWQVVAQAGDNHALAGVFGQGWQHYSLATSDSSGIWNAVYSYNREAGRHSIAAALPTPPGKKKDKRAETAYAYYAWVDGDTKAFASQSICQTADAAKGLAVQLYNYAYRQNSSSFCANLKGKDNTVLAHGDFGVANGVFTSHANQC